jgi:hypothetical protein
VPNGRGVRHRRPSSLRWPARHAASRCNTRTRSHHAAVTSDISRWCPQRPLTLGGRAVCSAGSVCLRLCWRHLRHRQVRALQLSVLARRVADVDDGHTDLRQAFSGHPCAHLQTPPQCAAMPEVAVVHDIGVDDDGECNPAAAARGGPCRDHHRRCGRVIGHQFTQCCPRPRLPSVRSLHLEPRPLPVGVIDAVESSGRPDGEHSCGARLVAGASCWSLRRTPTSPSRPRHDGPSENRASGMGRGQ